MGMESFNNPVPPQESEADLNERLGRGSGFESKNADEIAKLESMVSESQNKKELFSAIDKILENMKTKLAKESHDDLQINNDYQKEIIENILDDNNKTNLTPDDIPEVFGLRNKVKELLEAKSIGHQEPLPQVEFNNPEVDMGDYEFNLEKRKVVEEFDQKWEEAERTNSSPENVVEIGESEKESVIDTLRKEGEMPVFRLYQLFAKMGIMGGEFPSIESYRNRREDKMSSLSKLLTQTNEVLYGGLSLSARKAIEEAANLTESFAKKLAELSQKTSKKFSDAKDVYKIK